MIKMQNPNMPNAKLIVRGRQYVGDAEGFFSMEPEHADMVSGTKHWIDPRKRKRNPRSLAVSTKRRVERLAAEFAEAKKEAEEATLKAERAHKAWQDALRDDEEARALKEAAEAEEAAQEASDSETGSESSSDDEGAQAGSSDDDGGSDEVPPYAEWAYKDLVAEVKARIEADPEGFVTPDSKKTEDIVAALEADDARA